MTKRSGDAASQDSVLQAYCRILDSLPAAAFVCCPEGRVIHRTPQAAALWGPMPALSDAHDTSVLRRADGTAFSPGDGPVARALRERAAVRGERVRIACDGGVDRLAMVHVTSLTDGDDAPRGAVVLLLDTAAGHPDPQAQAERARQREEMRVALACDIRAGLDPLRRTAQDLATRAQAAGRGPAEAIDRQLRHVTQLVDRLLNLEVDLDDAVA